ncbi:kinase-like domain-containing protein [Leptodontidium sp. 2 PMI_412]|nr:kinase-like domain-containing protein [Leptodontidium sp. 2 PMI_412]
MFYQRRRRVPLTRGTQLLFDLEEGCFAVTFERKYYHRGDVFIKRSLRPREFRTGYRGLHVPRVGKERLLNEAASLRYIHEMTNIPVPTVYCDFEDDQAYYLITEYIQGVSMSELSDEQKATVFEEINERLTTVRNLKSKNIGGPSGIVIPPYRVTLKTENDDWALQPSDTDEYVFCHNDLSQHNIIVNPDTLKINAIIDWEYAGFYPDFFEAPFITRLGPSAAIKGEVDDTPRLLEFLNSRRRMEEAILID